MIIFDYTLFNVLIGTSLLGATAGALGVFALLKKQSLVGDAIAHAALPGIALTFLLTQTTQPSWLLLGGSIAGTFAIIILNLVQEGTTLEKSTVLGIILSVFFGFGLVLLTVIQKHHVAKPGLLQKFLFGNAATLLEQDIFLIKVIAAIVISCLFLFLKELKLFIFDPQFAMTIGYSKFILQTILTSLFILTIVIGLQTVGVILMSTMLIAPAAAARQWTHSFNRTILFASFIGATCAVLGSLISNISRLPTGPIIVVFLSFFVFASLVLSPRKHTL